MKNKKGITLVALVITVIILLILAGISISIIGGENGLITKTSQARKAQIESEIEEQLILAIQDLQVEKEGKATLDDITQEWIDKKLPNYKNKVTEDASINGKRIRIEKNEVVKKYIVDDKLKLTETNNGEDIEFSYDVGERIGEKVKILIHIQEQENGLTKIELPDKDIIIVESNKKEEKAIDYEVEIGKEYKIKITSESGKTEEKIILIKDYWYKVTRNLAEGINIDNTAVKVAYNKPYKAIVTTENNYALTTFVVTMGGNPVTVDKATGIINIEKVTGEIEIIATAKKIEIEYIAISINRNPSNQGSLEADTETKGTTLYINIIAKLEGQPCTVTLKDDETKVVPYAISKNGKYIFKVTGTYNGKTIIEEKEVIVNQYKTAKNLVKYDAGNWTPEEIMELQNKGLYNINLNKKASDTSGLNYTFGGFTYKGDTSNESYINNGTIVTSRNQSVAPQDKYGIPYYEGWQILESEEKEGKVYVKKLIHAGSPENFVFYSKEKYDGARAEYILSSGRRQITYNTYNARDWGMYKDKELEAKGYIKDVYIMTQSNASSLAEKQRDIGSYYFLASAYVEYTYNYGSLWGIVPGGTMYNAVSYNGTPNYESCSGLRPIIELNEGVYIVSGEGTEDSPYELGK